MGKIKLHWGHGILLVLVCFATGISYLVVKCMEQRVDLVSEDYYKQEIQYDNKMEKIRNSNSLLSKIDLMTEPPFVKIIYPNELKSAKGIVKFYRPNNSDYDFEKEISLNDSSMQLINTQGIVNGKWKISIDAKANGKEYYYEKNILIE